MEELYTCECRDGRTITGASRWSLYELRNLPPLYAIIDRKEISVRSAMRHSNA